MGTVANSQMGKLTPHLYLQPRLKLCALIPPLPITSSGNGV